MQVELRRPGATRSAPAGVTQQARAAAPEGPDLDPELRLEAARSLARSLDTEPRPGAGGWWAPTPTQASVDRNGIRVGADDETPDRLVEAPRSASGLGSRRGVSTHLVDLIEYLVDEIGELRDQVDRLEDRAEAAEDLARTALEATRDAQLQVRRAIQEQHGAITNDLGRLRTQVARQAEHDGSSFFRSDSDAVIAHFDAQLDWLFNELTSRLIVLGNQVAISGRQLRDTRPAPDPPPRPR